MAVQISVRTAIVLSLMVKGLCVASSDMIKVKVKLFLGFFNLAPRHEGVLGEWKYSSTHTLTSALGGDESSASQPAALPPS